MRAMRADPQKGWGSGHPHACWDAFDAFCSRPRPSGLRAPQPANAADRTERDRAFSHQGSARPGIALEPAEPVRSPDVTDPRQLLPLDPIGERLLLERWCFSFLGPVPSPEVAEHIRAGDTGLLRLLAEFCN